MGVPTGEFEELSVGAPVETSTVSFLSRFIPVFLLGRMAWLEVEEKADFDESHS